MRSLNTDPFQFELAAQAEGDKAFWHIDDPIAEDLQYIKFPKDTPSLITKFVTDALERRNAYKAAVKAFGKLIKDSPNDPRVPTW